MASISVTVIPGGDYSLTIPTGIPMMAKIIWATLAYMLWIQPIPQMYDFWYCHHDDNGLEKETYFTKQYRKMFVILQVLLQELSCRWYAKERSAEGQQ